jgi:ABC-2 type transport system ATP-binding protein
MIELQGVSATYGAVPGGARRAVLSSISGTLDAGLTVVVGPNGAGKTSLLRLLAGLLWPASGRVRYRGRDLVPQLRQYRLRLGYVPQRQASYPEMTALDFLCYMGALKGLAGSRILLRAAEVLEALDIRDLAASPLRAASHGQQRLVVLAQALLNDPDVLLLDEPLDGLDHDARRRAVRMLARPGRTIVLATHLPGLLSPRLEADAIWRLDGGRLLAVQ